MTSLVRPAINLAHRHFERRRHGIIVIGTWLTDGNRTQPCMVLLHGSRPIAAGRTVPVIIPLAEGWRYAVTQERGGGTIGDPDHASASINEWLMKGLLPGNPWNPRDHLKVLDAINENLRDLLAMPPKPRFGDYAVGDIVIKDRATGKVIGEKEITNDV